jgi:hypothetical protein
MPQYLVRKIATQTIDYVIDVPNVDPNAIGPFGDSTAAPTITPSCEPGCELIEWAGSFGRFNKQPTPTSALEWNGGPDPVWVERGDLDIQRAHKNAEINAAWISADSTAFPYAGEQFRAGADDALRLNSINGYISLTGEMPPEWVGVWKTMADTFIDLPNVESWKPFYTAFVMKGVTNYLAAQGLKARLAVATTAAEIASITWPE